MIGILYSYFIKYQKLSQLFPTRSYKYQYIDIYIDVANMLRPIYKNDNSKFIKENYYEIISLILNIAAHYRRFFYRENIGTRIYLIDGTYDSVTRLESSIFEYKTIYSEELRKYANNQSEMLKILTAYINDVFYIKKDADFSVITADLINRSTNGSLVITKDKYAYQLPAHCDTIIMRPQKSSNEDVSFVVNKNNALAKYYDKAKSELIHSRLVKFNPKLIGLMMSLTGVPSMNVKGLMNVTIASKLISDALDRVVMINNYNSDPNYLYEVLQLSKYVNNYTFTNRFNGIDIVVQTALYRSTPSCIDRTWDVNIHDPQSIQLINNKYFAKCPIDLNAL